MYFLLPWTPETFEHTSVFENHGSKELRIWWRHAGWLGWGWLGGMWLGLRCKVIWPWFVEVKTGKTIIETLDISKQWGLMGHGGWRIQVMEFEVVRQLWSHWQKLKKLERGSRALSTGVLIAFLNISGLKDRGRDTTSLMPSSSRTMLATFTDGALVPKQ